MRWACRSRENGGGFPCLRTRMTVGCALMRRGRSIREGAWVPVSTHENDGGVARHENERVGGGELRLVAARSGNTGTGR